MAMTQYEESRLVRGIHMDHCSIDETEEVELNDDDRMPSLFDSLEDDEDTDSGEPEEVDGDAGDECDDD